MKKGLYILGIIFFFGVVYLAGPKYKSPPLDRQIPKLLLENDSLEDLIIRRESATPGLKDDNAARIIWFNDSLKDKTPFAVVYLHGFAASQGEGFPVHINFARRYGFNLYLTRLHGHGLNSDTALMDMTPVNLVNSAKEAIAVGKQLGDKVILMSTSTGGTLSLYLAAGDQDISGIILFSPNIKINNPFVPLLTGHWGLQIGRLFAGGKNRRVPVTSREDSLYWNSTYRVDAILYLQSLIEMTMKNNIFKSITQPVFLAYYYRDQKHQDPVVRVDAMNEMFENLGTRENMKMKRSFPESGNHVIACKYKSEAWESVEGSTFRFAEEILDLKPVD
ncbi:MAG TPA: alpha/beta fold hydrolase [Cyclobacteriaceae bacterium]|nr:alpha/beta fold hydrolase [Cyclobacteriaceae bacterium]